MGWDHVKVLEGRIDRLEEKMRSVSEFDLPIPRGRERKSVTGSTIKLNGTYDYERMLEVTGPGLLLGIYQYITCGYSVFVDFSKMRVLIDGGIKEINQTHRGPFTYVKEQSGSIEVVRDVIGCPMDLSGENLIFADGANKIDSPIFFNSLDCLGSFQLHGSDETAKTTIRFIINYIPL